MNILDDIKKVSAALGKIRTMDRPRNPDHAKAVDPDHAKAVDPDHAKAVDPDHAKAVDPDHAKAAPRNLGNEIAEIMAGSEIAATGVLAFGVNECGYARLKCRHGHQFFRHASDILKTRSLGDRLKSLRCPSCSVTGKPGRLRLELEKKLGPLITLKLPVGLTPTILPAACVEAYTVNGITNGCVFYSHRHRILINQSDVGFRLPPADQKVSVINVGTIEGRISHFARRVIDSDEELREKFPSGRTRNPLPSTETFELDGMSLCLENCIL